MWFTVRVIGDMVEDFFGDASEFGGWVLFGKTNNEPEAKALEREAIRLYGADNVWFERVV